MKKNYCLWNLGVPSRLAALLIVVLGIFAVAFAATLKIDNRIERWIGHNDADAAVYKDFVNTFGSDEFVVIAYSGRPLFSEDMLVAQLNALRELESISCVRSVQGIPVVFRDLFGAEEVEALEEEFLSTEFYRDVLISRDGTVGGMLVETIPPETPSGRREMVESIHRAVGPLSGAGFEVHLAGPPLLNAVLDEISESESQRVFPVAFCCSLLVLLILFRSVRATLVALLCSSWSVMLTLGLIAVSGRSLNMVSSVLPALLWVLSLSGMVHILWRYQALRNACACSREAMALAMNETFRACSLAGITTALGFVSLGVSNMAPVRELGFFAAVGIMMSIAVNYFLGAWLTICLGVPGRLRGPSGMLSRVSGSFARFLDRHSGKIVLAAMVLMASFVFCTLFIRVESDPLVFLPRDNATVRDYAYVGENLTGYYSLEMVLDLDSEWINQRHLEQLDRLGNALADVPGVVRVLSPVDILKKLYQWDNDFSPEYYSLPPAPEISASLIGELDDNGRAQLRRLVDDEGRTARFSIMINVMNSRDFLSIAQKAKDLLAEEREGLAGKVTGIVYQLVNAQSALVRSQLASIVAAFFAIFLSILVGLRSWKLMGISILPNIFPIFAALACMALADIALDAATVMVASVALGIAVDDTVHFIQAYRRAVGAGMNPATAVERSFYEVGPAMVITTVTACIGFFALMRSAFLPILWFGLLSGIAMIVALLADLLVGPSLLLLADRKASKG